MDKGDDQPGETSAAIRERVLRARTIQTERFKHSKLVHCNAMMNNKMVRHVNTARWMQNRINYWNSR